MTAQLLNMKVAVIGGGAAGFFSALQVKENFPDAQVTIFEKTGKLLSKVKVSGGGRCNVTNGQSDIEILSAAYPRGMRLMKRALWSFNTTDIRQWFEERGVGLYVQEDGRVFPTTDDSSTIVDCFLQEARLHEIQIKIKSPVVQIEKVKDKIQIKIKGQDQMLTFDRVIVATGGSPKREGFEWLQRLGHRIVPPVPSLFTFNMPDEEVSNLMGVSVDPVEVVVQGSKLSSEGPLLITHWGMSGPAVLKLSAFGARELHDLNYNFSIRVNWTAMKDHGDVAEQLTLVMRSQADKAINLTKPFNLPKRLWSFLIERAGVDGTKRWINLQKKAFNRLVHVLTNDVYRVRGKTTFKEEFVTCGGVDLKSIDWKTMESKAVPGLYFAGEILDIDGVTGGYNFQAAWTTAFLAAKLGKV